MRILLLLVSLMLVGCSVNSNRIEKSNEERHSSLASTLEYLSSDALQGRNSGEPGAELASEFLIENFRKYNVLTLFSSYKDTLTTFENSWNVVGLLPGTDSLLRDQYVVLGAHYDHIGLVEAVDGDSIANGANDNASGVAVLNEIVRVLAQKKFKRSIIIAYFSAEEKGLLGSQHLAKKLKAKGYEPSFMLNFEMLGVPMDRPFLTFLTGYQSSNMAQIIDQNHKGVVGYFQGEHQRSLFSRSDNYPFYVEFNIPSHTFCSFDFENYSYYHHVKDQYENVDLEHMKIVTKNIIPVVEQLINAPDGLMKMTNEKHHNNGY